MQAELPFYTNHRLRQAFKIDDRFRQKSQTNDSYGFKYSLVGYGEDGQTLYSVTVDQSYIDKHNPQVGGYFIRYEDGYESFCPAESFESGNSLVDSDDTPDDAPADTTVEVVEAPVVMGVAAAAAILNP